MADDDVQDMLDRLDVQDDRVWPVDVHVVSVQRVWIEAETQAEAVRRAKASGDLHESFNEPSIDGWWDVADATPDSDEPHLRHFPMWKCPTCGREDFYGLSLHLSPTGFDDGRTPCQYNLDRDAKRSEPVAVGAALQSGDGPGTGTQ